MTCVASPQVKIRKARAKKPRYTGGTSTADVFGKSVGNIPDADKKK